LSDVSVLDEITVSRDVSTGKYVAIDDYLPPAPSNWRTARLPQLYLAAIEALDQCSRVDQCVEWANRAEAYASYYRQAKDRTLFHMAQRIKLRAMRRCGELFLELDAGDPSAKSRTGRKTSIGPIGAHATASGLRPETVRASKILAKLPAAEFEARIEIDPPPTLRDMDAMYEDAKRAQMPPHVRKAKEVCNAVATIAREADIILASRNLVACANKMARDIASSFDVEDETRLTIPIDPWVYITVGQYLMLMGKRLQDFKKNPR
jgi:hypothetical protein